MTSKIFLIRLRLKNGSFAVTRPTQLWRCQLKIFYWTSKSKFFFEFPKHFLRQLNIKFYLSNPYLHSVERYPDNCLPRKIAPRLGLGFRSRSELVLGLGETRQLSPRKIAPWLGLGFGLVLGLWVEGNFPRGQFMNIFFRIVLIFPCCFSFKIFSFGYELFLISLGK